MLGEVAEEVIGTADPVVLQEVDPEALPVKLPAERPNTQVDIVASASAVGARVWRLMTRG